MPSREVGLARYFRREMMVVEEILWKHLRGRNCGFKFRRQHPIGPYIVDFFCSEAKLIVEIDGVMHDADKDAARTAYLEEAGYVVIRFTNEQVMTQLESVLGEITKTCERRQKGFGAVHNRYEKDLRD